MKNLGTVIGFEFKSFLRKKAYIITTIILIIISLAATSIPTIINFFTDGKGISDFQFGEEIKFGYYTDNPEIENYIKNSEKLSKLILYSDKVELEKSVEDEKIKKGFIFESDKEISAYVIDTGFDEGIDKEVLNIASKYNRDKILVSKGIDPDIVEKSINNDVNLKTEIIGKDSKSSFATVYISMITTYFLIIMYGSIVATSVAREKSDRTMELLITSTSPKSLIIGKVISATFVGILQLLLIALAVIIGLFINKGSYPEGILESIGLTITADGLAVMVIFSILGCFMYLFLFAALGALVSKIEDVNTSISPVMFIFVAVYMITNFTLAMPDKAVARIASIVPFSSPMAMVARYSLVSVPIFELALSFGLLLITTLLIAFIAIKIYRMGTLNYGNRLGFIKAIRMSFKK